MILQSIIDPGAVPRRDGHLQISKTPLEGGVGFSVRAGQERIELRVVGHAETVKKSPESSVQSPENYSSQKTKL
jgi:hypothetical protein